MSNKIKNIKIPKKNSKNQIKLMQIFSDYVNTKNYKKNGS